MPVKTPDQLKERAASLKKKLAETRGKMDGAAVRKMKKRIRRAQRRRRKVIATAERRTKAAKKAETPQS